MKSFIIILHLPFIFCSLLCVTVLGDDAKKSTTNLVASSTATNFSSTETSTTSTQNPKSQSIANISAHTSMSEPIPGTFGAKGFKEKRINDLAVPIVAGIVLFVLVLIGGLIAVMAAVNKRKSAKKKAVADKKAGKSKPKAADKITETSPKEDTSKKSIQHEDKLSVPTSEPQSKKTQKTGAVEPTPDKKPETSAERKSVGPQGETTKDSGESAPKADKSAKDGRSDGDDEHDLLHRQLYRQLRLSPPSSQQQSRRSQP